MELRQNEAARQWEFVAAISRLAGARKPTKLGAEVALFLAI
jgi:hypothetical protein